MGTRDNDKVISTVQFALIPVPEVQGEISLTEFCLTTNILYQGIDMLNQKKPITVEFQYDGSFEITAGVAQNDAIGEKVEDKTIFTANAFVCNPDFTPSSKLLSIGSILYVCVRPAEDQITTKITQVDYFTLEKVAEDISFYVVSNGQPSPVTVVTGLDTRKVIIGVRVPSQFYNTDANVT